MNDAKYIGMDVHQATISVAVRDSVGNLVMEAILETKSETIRQFIRGLRDSLHVTFEEGISAAWLYDLLKPHVTKVVACDPRKNPLLKVGNHNDREDARKLSELLYMNKLSSVFHGEKGIRTLRELARSYLTTTRDPRYRAEWLAKITETGVRRRAEIYYQQFDVLARLRQGNTPRVISRRQKTLGHPITATDSCDGPHPRRSVDCADADIAPIPSGNYGPTAALPARQAL
jgi:Transposase